MKFNERSHIVRSAAARVIFVAVSEEAGIIVAEIVGWNGGWRSERSPSRPPILGRFNWHYTEALESFENALELDPKLPDVVAQ